MSTNLPNELELLLPDMNGVPRGKTIAGTEYSETNLPHLAEAIFFQTITGGYSDAFVSYDPNDGDLLMKADWSTYRSTPWKPGDVGQVICETQDKQGNPIPYDPRNVLKRVLSVYNDLELFPVIAPEVEFYLLEPLTLESRALSPALGTNNMAEFGGEAFSPDALDKFAPIIQDIQRMCADAQLSISGVVHEMGPAQIELNVGHGDPLDRADQLFLLKRLVKACAVKHGLLASFMAKPLSGLPGNGLHLHCSVLNKDGDNIFALKRKKAQPQLQQFIAGLQIYLPQAFALIAPNVNSYKRFVPDLSAPINLAWGYDNRTTGLRVPYSEPQAGRVENRVSGADANPYLMIAATLACGLLGLRSSLSPTKPVAGDAFELAADFPEDLADALRTLEKSKVLVSLLGESFVDVFASVKRSELRDFNKAISPWEVGFLGSML